MPRGKGRKVLTYRNATAGRRPPPVAPRQVERQNLRRRRPRAQLEPAEYHGVPVQVQQPNDNYTQPAYQPAPAHNPQPAYQPATAHNPQPAYQPAPAHNPQPAYQPAPVKDHHNENAPPPHILPVPQVVQPVPQIENGEAIKE